MKHIAWILGFTIAHAAPGLKDISLLNISGQAWKMHAVPDTKLFVFISASTGCPIIRRYLPVINQLSHRYKNVAFYLVYTGRHETLEQLKVEAHDFAIEPQVLLDSSQNFSRTLGFRVTSEVAVVDGKTLQPLYLGPIDDRFTYEAQRVSNIHPFLDDAIDKAIHGQAPAKNGARAYGCVITYSI